MTRIQKVLIIVAIIIGAGLIAYIVIARPGRKVGPLEKIRTWNLEDRVYEFYYAEEELSEAELKKLSLTILDDLLEDHDQASVIILYDRRWAKKVSSSRSRDAVLPLEAGVEGFCITSASRINGGSALTVPCDTSRWEADSTFVYGPKFEALLHPSKDIWMAWRYEERRVWGD